MKMYSCLLFLLVVPLPPTVNWTWKHLKDSGTSMFICQNWNRISSITLLHKFFLVLNYSGFVFNSINLPSPQGISHAEKFRYDFFSSNFAANLHDLICLTPVHDTVVKALCSAYRINTAESTQIIDVSMQSKVSIWQLHISKHFPRMILDHRFMVLSLKYCALHIVWIQSKDLES